MPVNLIIMITWKGKVGNDNGEKKRYRKMRLWTIQPEKLYTELLREKVVSCKPELSAYLQEWGFESAYDWMVSQMEQRIGAATPGVKYPIWAWYTLEGKNEKPDLRKTEFRYYRENQACIELEVPDQDVLLSDECDWHIVLNNWYLIKDGTGDNEFDREYEWFKTLPETEQEIVKRKSWENIFHVRDENEEPKQYVQATFWELRLEYVRGVRFFKGRLKEK